MTDRGATPSAAGNLARRGVALGTLHANCYRVEILESVLEAVVDYSERDLQRELGGFLLGRPTSAAVLRVEIQGFLPAVDVQSRASSLTFTHDTWAAMTREVEQKFPHGRVVGWQHTHPGFGVFLSGYDLFIHRHFFSQPWQVALVVDPRRRELGFFQWCSDDVSDCGFVCVQGC
jgi:proteasome lid subunit RPN8/RPN11